MEIKIALTNLGAYNEGKLQYTWLDLPVDEDAFQEALDEIGIDSVRYEEYFISDYEAPFEISEHADINALNKLAEALEDIEDPKVHISGSFYAYEVEKVLGMAQQLEGKKLIEDALDHIDDIISDERLNEMLQAKVEDGDDWTSIRIFLQDADPTNHDWHYLDGYDNAGRLTDDILEMKVSEMLQEAKDNA